MKSPNRRHDLPLLYKYTDAATAQTILRTRSLRWSSPVRFNDPFDVPRELGLPFSSKSLKDAIQRRFEDYFEGKATPCSPASKALVSAMSKVEAGRRDLMRSLLQESLHLFTIRAHIAIDGFRNAWLDKIRHLRIVCFSATSESPTMWAHYADEHRGVVLAFESSDERDSAFLLATEVIYRDQPPALPLVDRWVRAFLGEEEIDWDEYFREYYYVKTTDWSYEREYRAVSARVDNTTLFYDSPFFAEDLRGVILGTAISASDEAAMRALTSAYPRATVHRAYLDSSIRRVSHDPVACD